MTRDLLNMDYKSFREDFKTIKDDIALDVFRINRESIHVKKEKTAIKNYGRIFDAVFNISREKGFQAMSLRDLSQETGLSMGALYRYFSSKDDLLLIMLQQGQVLINRVISTYSQDFDNPAQELRAVIKLHLFLSEAARDWFVFTFMEAKNLKGESLKKIFAMEAYTEKLVADVLERGEQQGTFRKRDHAMTAGMIKALQQDWYLKRWKFSRKRITVDHYAERVIEMAESYCLP